MQYDWIIDVLSDLKTFAQSNGLSALAEQLDDSILVAATEIAQAEEESVGGMLRNAEPAGALHRAHSAGDNV
ncbi:MAG: hypothetical protein N2422_04600 [Rhodobacteraceae bacterium]|nr:hypothetical protein [Paracoccaceae bacterium]